MVKPHRRYTFPEAMAVGLGAQCQALISPEVSSGAVPDAEGSHIRSKTKPGGQGRVLR